MNDLHFGQVFRAAMGIDSVRHEPSYRSVLINATTGLDKIAAAVIA
jgi:hypothetical protein